MLRSSLLLVFVLLLVTGCGAEEAAPSLKAELRYERSGGFAGVHEELVIHPDGRAELTVSGHEQQQFRLSEDEYDALVNALEDADLASVGSDVTSGGPVPDAFIYTVRYQGKEVRTDDAAIPRDLRPLVSVLNRLVQEHRPRAAAGSRLPRGPAVAFAALPPSG